MAKILMIIGGYVLSSFLLKIFSVLGLTILSYKFIYTFVETALNKVQPMFSSLPANALNILALMGVPEALSIVCSALLTAAFIQSLKTSIGVVS